ncbi:MAG TPA: alpha/beta hydrolase [Myxococcales bacterium]|nr:alpha/beta hydrolase [Myxococcales bacterium]
MRVPLSELSLEVRDEGRGPPALLLHGFPTSNRLWDGVVPRLCAAGFRCIAPDLAGYGLSDAPADGEPRMERQARWLVELLDVLGIDSPLLVAHDVGSAAAEILAAESPQRVRGLIVADGVHADRWAMEWVESIQQWDPAKAARLAPVLARRLRGPALPSEAVSALLSSYQGERGGLRLIQAARALRPSETATRLQALRGCGVPALVLWGDDDRYLPIDSVARPLADLLRAELHLIPGGHFLPAEAPAKVAEEIVAFEKTLRA